MMPSALGRSTGIERKRVRRKKMRKIVGQARPTSSRLAPVMLAMARWALRGLVGAVQAKYRSTAYSGRTAMRARTTSARVAEISVSATSEAQVRRVAAAAMARPKRTASPTLPRSTWARSVTSSRRMTGAGRAPRTARAITVQWRTGGGLICAEDAPCGGGGGAWASGGAAWLAAQYSIAYCRHIAASLTPPFAPRYTQSHEETMPQNNHHSGSKKQWLDDTYARSVERGPARGHPFQASDGPAARPADRAPA